VSASEDRASEPGPWFLERCARAGLKATRQRRQIYEVLADTGEHPDAEAVHERVRRRIPSVSLDTIYRNLRAMAEHGIIQKVGATGPRTRYDVNIAPHHHFVCTGCGRIRDFHDDRFESYRPTKVVRELGDVDLVHVELRGTCHACRDRNTGRK